MGYKGNVFSDFQDKKRQVRLLADEALKTGWIDETTHAEILAKIDADVLTIGVIGQMKCGKSTFLNAFLFGRQLLPAATTPMTAALSVITYGEQEKIAVEFYTSQEWEELKTLASREIEEDSDSQTRSSIQAAKELYGKSEKIRSELPALLGTTREDRIDNLIEYVGADGTYVAIVKSVRIYLPETWLKGVEIVDTPGFNDPVVSREERTKEFLKRADVVLMMLYAGRAFDATDRDILFDKVRKVGVGKIILAVNKYDLQLLQNESPETIKGNVMDELRKAKWQLKDPTVDEMLEDLDPVLISSQMALLAKMPLTEINGDPTLQHHFNDICKNFELTNQSQLLELSRIGELEAKVRDVIVNQKEGILIQKPKNMILQKARNAMDEIETCLLKLKEQKTNLEIPDHDLDVRIENLKKAQRRMDRKIENAKSDLAEAYDDVTTRLFRKIQDLADAARDDCSRIIEQYRKKNLERRLADRLTRFQEREFPRVCEDASKSIKTALSDTINQLSEDIADLVDRYLSGSHEDSDELADKFARTLKKGLVSNIEGVRKDERSDEDDITFGDIIIMPFILPTILVATGIERIFSSRRDDAREARDQYFNSIDWEGIKRQFGRGQQKFIDTLNGEGAMELIGALTKQAEEAKGSKAEKEQKLQEVQTEIQKLVGQKETLESQYKKLEHIL